MIDNFTTLKFQEIFWFGIYAKELRNAPFFHSPYQSLGLQKSWISHDTIIFFIIRIFVCPITDKDYLKHQLTVEVDLKKFNVPVEFGLKTNTELTEDKFDHSVNLYLHSSKDKSEYTYHVYAHSKESGMEALFSFYIRLK